MAVLVGNAATDGGDDSFGAGDLAGTRYQAVASGDVAVITFPIRASGFTSLKCALYADSAGQPAAKLGETSAITDTTAGIKTLTMVAPVTVTSGTFYWLALLALGSFVDCSRHAGAPGYDFRTGQSSFPDPWGTSDVEGAGTGIAIQAEDSGAATGVQINTPTFQAIPFMGGH